VRQLNGDHVSEPLHRVGLISDTHGLIRPGALDALRESDLIVHCGDIGDLAVLEALRSIAPLRAIRGNNDKGAWAASLPTSDVVEVGSHAIYVLHNLSELDLDPAVAGFTAVVSGHSHKPIIQKRGEILFVNPGSAGPRRFTLPVTVATLALWSGRCEASIVPLALSQTPRKRDGST
jgi:putative phosphoesterase